MTPRGADEWHTVTVTCPAGVAEVVADVLWQFGPPAVEERPAEVASPEVLLRAEIVPEAVTAPEEATDRDVLILAGYPDLTTADRAAHAVTDLLCGSVALGTGLDVPRPGRTSVTVTPVEDDGLDAWREHAQVTAAGPFLLVPSWLEPDLSGVEGNPTTVIRIDPGRTFGSGSHPTTRLVLAATARLLSNTDNAASATPTPGRSTPATPPFCTPSADPTALSEALTPTPLVDGGPRPLVLDVGCGSGVLAIGAALLGAEAVGVDVDPASAKATMDNARLNGVEDRITFDPRPLALLAADARAGVGRFDLVLANLLSPIVVEMAADLVEVVAPGGHLVVSGLLSERRDAAVEALTAAASAADARATGEPPAEASLRQLDAAEDDGWVALTFGRTPT